PVNESERLVCGAFERVLGLKRVGRNGDFFELGGTSLSVISLLSEEGFEKLSASELMQNPVVKDLAVLLNNSREKCLDYLEPLYVAEKAESAFVLFPFGGGAAEGFSSLVKEIKHKHGNVSVYFIRYLHSAAECEMAAEEIKEVFSGVKVSFYSHCAGAAVAMKVLENLEKDSFTVTHFYAGAIIPSARKDGKSLWTTVPDFVIKNAFLKAGAGLDGISVKKQKEIISRFRKDTDYAYRAFFEAKAKFQTPVTVIISKKDIFTYNYRQAEAQWKKYAENLNGIKFINAKGHYFQTDNAQRLTEILFG
ncbi:MAG: hypothetical protein IIX36_06965, partial [Clostridia bacterium]|nr:hypothetical protein [Clostridia bacterium]